MGNVFVATSDLHWLLFLAFSCSPVQAFEGSMQTGAALSQAVVDNITASKTCLLFLEVPWFIEGINLM